MSSQIFDVVTNFSRQIRNFITAMHEHLLKQHLSELNSCGMEVCDNAGHVVECALQECVLQPLSHFVYLRIEEFYATNGHLFQVQRSIHQGRLKTTEEMGIRVSVSTTTHKLPVLPVEINGKLWKVMHQREVQGSGKGYTSSLFITKMQNV